MKHAYLIIAHNEFKILEKLVHLLDDSRNDIYLHIDRKVKLIPNIKCQHAGLYVLNEKERLDVRWGSISQIKVELQLFIIASKNHSYGYYHPSLYAGLGFAWTYDEPGNGKSRSHEISASIGTSNDFRLSDAWAINLDVRGMFVNDRFDGEMGHRWGEGVLSATIGLTYNIAPRGWNKSKTVVKTVNNNIADFQKALSESEAERIRLEKELGELRAQPQIVEKQTTIAAPYFVIFEINKSKLSKDSRVNLGMLAEIIKANNIKYIVTGYADAATGNKKINDKLSRKRAEAVYECLTKEFGVPESLLEIDHKGGVENMFYDDPALSRAAITKAL